MQDEITIEGTAAEAYVISTTELAEKVEALKAELEKAGAHNERVVDTFQKLRVAGIGEAAIASAMEAEFGKPPRKRASPTPRTEGPSELEKRALEAMTSEGMSRRAILEAAGIANEAATKDLLSGMARAGWIENQGGKGLGASWVLTDSGRERIDA